MTILIIVVIIAMAVHHSWCPRRWHGYHWHRRHHLGQRALIVGIAILILYLPYPYYIIFHHPSRSSTAWSALKMFTPSEQYLAEMSSLSVTVPRCPHA